MRLAGRWMVCLLAAAIIVAFIGAYHRRSVGQLVQSTTTSVWDNLPFGEKTGDVGDGSGQPPAGGTPPSSKPPSSPPPANPANPANPPKQPSKPPPSTSPSASSSSASSQYAAIRAFWQKWSAAMVRARPDCPDIVLHGTARTDHPADRHAPRRPYRDLVHNPDADLDALHDAHARLVADLQANLTETDTHHTFRGRGIVMVGGGEYFGPAIVSIYMLRRTGSTLPVEVFVPDDGEYETAVCEGYLRRLNAECRVLSSLWKDSDALPPLQHYQLKAAALLLSSFAEVLLLDSDSMPLVDPAAQLFDVRPFIDTPMLLWPDFWAATESPRFWTRVVRGRRGGGSDEDEDEDEDAFDAFPAALPATSSEAGQLLVDKRTHLAPLLLATYYNIYGRSHYYHLLSQGALGEGDKETFLAAAVALNASYHRVETEVVSIGRFDGREHRGTAMVQHLPGGGGEQAASPAFLHCNTPKMNAGHLIDEGDLVAKDDGQLRLRLLGPADEQERRFGYDIEGILWDLLVQTGCELASVIREWQHRERMCERLTEARELITGRTGPIGEVEAGQGKKSRG